MKLWIRDANIMISISMAISQLLKYATKPPCIAKIEKL